MITADQIVAHLIGDYLLQSDWMAQEKTRRIIVAWIHGVCYALPFLFLRPSPGAALAIAISHAIIDRWRLAKYICWMKNWLTPHGYFQWQACNTTGYVSTRPDWLAVWLMIIADNTLHLLCNGAALRWL